MSTSFFRRLLFSFIIPIISTSTCGVKKTTSTNLESSAIAIIPQKIKNDIQEKKEQRVIKIWIHGTLGLSKTIFPKYFLSIPGLWPTAMYEKGNSLFDIGTMLSKKAPKSFATEDLYFFGWTGKLSEKARLYAAKKLYVLIIKKLEEYKQKYGIVPKIILITHSHGGNVALHLSEVQKNKKQKISIDELVLLACPVQKRTANLIKDSMFKHIFSFYSKLDLIQVLDPQGLHDVKKIWLGTKKRNGSAPFFSARQFENQENLLQMQVKISGRAITHVEFILDKFVRRLPKMLKELRVEKNWEL